MEASNAVPYAELEDSFDHAMDSARRVVAGAHGRYVRKPLWHFPVFGVAAAVGDFDDYLTWLGLRDLCIADADFYLALCSLSACGE